MWNLRLGVSRVIIVLRFPVLRHGIISKKIFFNLFTQTIIYSFSVFVFIFGSLTRNMIMTLFTWHKEAGNLNCFVILAETFKTKGHNSKSLVFKMFEVMNKIVHQFQAFFDRIQYFPPLFIVTQWLKWRRNYRAIREKTQCEVMYTVFLPWKHPQGQMWLFSTASFRQTAKRLQTLWTFRLRKDNSFCRHKTPRKLWCWKMYPERLVSSYRFLFNPHNFISSFTFLI